MRFKGRYLGFAFAIVVLFSPNIIADPNGIDQPATIFFGSSKVDITPPIGTPLSGYGRRHGKPSKGIRDPLYARVISLSSRNTKFFIVSLDLVLIDAHFRSEVLERVRKKMPLDDSELLIFATHTHSGSGSVGKRFWERFISGAYRKKIFREMVSKISDAIISAHDAQVSVTAECGEVDASGFVENRMDPSAQVRERLQVIRFKSSKETVVGQIVFFAAHPTMLSAKNRHFSGDFPGVLSHYLEAEFPESIAMFANGATGDLRPSGVESDYPDKRLERYGRALYDLTHNITFSPLDLSGDWMGAYDLAPLPNVKARAGFVTIPSIVGNRFFPRKAPIQMMRMGKALLIALPAEVASETGHQIEERITGYGLLPLVVTHANDYVGYVVPERYYVDQRQYESRASFYGKYFEFFIHDQVDKAFFKIIAASKFNDHYRAFGTAVKNEVIPLVYLKGTPYQLGLQHGKLMSREIGNAKREIYRFLARKGKVPLISKPIVKWILSRSWRKMEPFITYDEWMELKGLAEGSGLSLADVKRLHAIPDLIESMCTNGIYFGSATKDGKLIHIRNLDWVREMGVYRYAAVIFYEPQWGNRYVNLGYYGFIGSLTGVSERGISVGQVGADSVDESLRGTPMPFLLKRVLLKANSLDEAASMIVRSGRTSSFNYVFGDAQEKKAIGIETTHSLSQLFSDNDPLEMSSGYGFPLPGVLMRADPAFDPKIRNLQTCSHGNPKKEGIEPPSGGAYETRYRKQSELVKAHYGSIDVEEARMIAREVAPDSNIQSVIVKFPEVWIANATDSLPAAKSDYFHFNFNDLLSKLRSLSGADKN